MHPLSIIKPDVLDIARELDVIVADEPEAKGFNREITIENCINIKQAMVDGQRRLGQPNPSVVMGYEVYGAVRSFDRRAGDQTEIVEFYKGANGLEAVKAAFQAYIGIVVDRTFERSNDAEEAAEHLAEVETPF